jgi:ElaB/YqjD/DUF883 family membrane-anchored ribosome-binding protein
MRNGDQRTNGSRTNGGQRPEEILAEIDRTRHEMDRTLSAIEHRLTPGQLVDQGLDYLRTSGANEFVQNLGGTAKQNPMPLALTAVGLAWLMALGRNPAQQNDGSTSSAGIREGMSSGMRSMRGKASGAMQSASESLGSMRDRAGQVTDAARSQLDRAKSGIDYLVHEQPLALGAVGLAIGALLGAAAPRTRVEEQVMGEASQNITQKAKEVAESTMGDKKGGQ